MEAAPRFELGVGDLQSHALPLGHAAVKKADKSAEFTMERATGFEPATSTLARLRATNCAKPALRYSIYRMEGLRCKYYFQKVYFNSFTPGKHGN